jgi:predicted nucleic acid-binding protein
MIESSISPGEIVLVDTSAWICFFARKGYDEIKQSMSSLLDENRLAITGPILIEVIQGCRTETEKRDIMEVLDSIHWLHIAEETWRMASDIAFNLRRKGVTISAIDVIIAAVSINHHVQLLHKDRDYDLIAKYTKLKIYKV